MTQPLPRWVMQRYSKLWSEFEGGQFEHSQAREILKGDNMVSIVLSTLRKSGWMDAGLNAKDLRRRTYRLKNPEKAIREISRSKVK